MIIEASLLNRSDTQNCISSPLTVKVAGGGEGCINVFEKRGHVDFINITERVAIVRWRM